MNILPENAVSAMERYKIFFEADMGKVGVDVYHPMYNRIAVVFYPDSIAVGEDQFSDCTVSISYPNDITKCQIALKELADLVDPFNLAYLTLNKIVDDQDRYFEARRPMDYESYGSEW